MISEIGEVFQKFGFLITEFGPYVFGLVSLLLIIVLLFILLIYIVKTIPKNEKDESKDIALLIKDAIRTELDSKEKESKSNKENNLMDIFLKLNSGLKYTVRELVSAINADRVAFYLFHNGTHSINGIPFLKMSCVCEIDRNGISSYRLMQTHKDIPLNLLDNIVEILTRQHEFVIYKNDNKFDVLVAKVFFDEQDKTCLFNGIFEQDTGQLLGFIVAEYDTVERFSDADLEYKMNKLRKTAKYTSATMQVFSTLR